MNTIKTENSSNHASYLIALFLGVPFGNGD